MWPGLLAVLAPVALGLLFDLRRDGATTCWGPRRLLGFSWRPSQGHARDDVNNSGGAWDNGGASRRRQAVAPCVVTGDTVGDPFKDNSGAIYPF